MDETDPAAIHDFAVHFDAPATSGTATFTLPTKTFDGDDNLTGQLTYETQGQRQRCGHGSGCARCKVNATLSNLPEGETEFVLVVKNSVGPSPKASAEIYVGYDQPLAPTEVTLKQGQGNKATLSWVAPRRDSTRATWATLPIIFIA